MLVIKKSFFWVIIILNLVVVVSFQNCAPASFSKIEPKVTSLSCELTDVQIVVQSLSVGTGTERVRLTLDSSAYDQVEWTVRKPIPNSSFYDLIHYVLVANTGRPDGDDKPVLNLGTGIYVIDVHATQNEPNEDCTGDDRETHEVSNSNLCNILAISGAPIARVGDTKSFTMSRSGNCAPSALVDWTIISPNGTPENRSLTLNASLSKTFMSVGTYNFNAVVPSVSSTTRTHAVVVSYRTCSVSENNDPARTITKNHNEQLIRYIIPTSCPQLAGADPCNNILKRTFRCDGNIGQFADITNANPADDIIISTTSESCRTSTLTCGGNEGICATPPHGGSYRVFPSIPLCGVGNTDSNFSTNLNTFTWKCSGPSGTTPANCSANRCSDSQIVPNNTCVLCPFNSNPDANTNYTTCLCLSGSYNPTTNQCDAVTPTTCKVFVGPTQVGTLANGKSQKRYLKDPTCGQACSAEFKTCSNGVDVIFSLGYTFTETGTNPGQCSVTPCAQNDNVNRH